MAWMKFRIIFTIYFVCCNLVAEDIVPNKNDNQDIVSIINNNFYLKITAEESAQIKNKEQEINETNIKKLLYKYNIQLNTNLNSFLNKEKVNEYKVITGKKKIAGAGVVFGLNVDELKKGDDDQYIINNTGEVTVEKIIPNLGGELAGLKLKDKILKVNNKIIGSDLTSLKQVVNEMRGLEETTFDLEVKRGDQKLQLVVTRKKMEKSSLSVEYNQGNGQLNLDFNKMIVEGDYLYLLNFIDKLEKLPNIEIKFIQVDLSKTISGDFDIIQSILKLFAKKDSVISYREERQNGEITKIINKAESDGIFHKAETMVKVTENTTSGGEYLAYYLYMYGAQISGANISNHKPYMAHYYPLKGGEAIMLVNAKLKGPAGEDYKDWMENIKNK